MYGNDIGDKNYILMRKRCSLQLLGIENLDFFPCLRSSKVGPINLNLNLGPINLNLNQILECGRTLEVPQEITVVLGIFLEQLLI